jgi:hypothetical protein
MVDTGGIAEISAGASEYTALDFAVIALLEDLKHTIVLPKIGTWLRLFDEDQVKVPDAIRRRQNLAAGILGIWKLVSLPEDYQGQRDALHRFVWDETRDCAELKGLLKRYGHYLFNSYYYTLIGEFGQPGLVPAIPGETRPSSREAKGPLRSFIAKNKLPLHINEAYLDTYATLNLPLRAGITPRYVDLYKKGGKNSAWLVPNFLGDLAILEKREDYVHRHLCAIIGVLGGREKPQGAFILTCAIPGELDDKDCEKLDKLISDSWNSAAPFGEIHSGVTRTTRSIVGCLEWAGGSYGSVPLAEETQQIEERIKQCLADMVPRGAYGLRGAFYDADRRLCQLAALNSEGLQQTLDCQFPTSAWLDPELVKEEVVASSELVKKEAVAHPELQINTIKLRQICQSLETLSSRAASRESRKNAFDDLMKRGSWRGIVGSIYPDVEQETLMTSLLLEGPLLPGQSEGMRALLFRSPVQINEEPVSEPETVSEFLKLSSDVLQKPALPGAANSTLARLQRIWNQSQGPEPQPADGPERDALIVQLANSLKRILGESSIRGILLLTESATYIPEFPQVEAAQDHVKTLAAFQDAFCSYPSFWMFETLCHSFSEDIEISALQVLIDNAGSSPPFRAMDQGYAVTRCSDDRIDGMVATAFTYLGIPVKRWLPRDTDLSQTNQRWQVPGEELELQRWLNDRYRDYLRDELKCGEDNKSISRAIGSGFQIKSIEVSESTGECVQMTIALEELGSSLQVNWRRVPTVDLAFCAFSVDSLCRKHAGVLSNLEETKIDTLEIDTLEADGSSRRISVRKHTPNSLGNLFQALHERSQTLRLGFQAGLSEKFQRFTHQALKAHAWIKYLFDVVPLSEVLGSIRAGKRISDRMLSLWISLASIVGFSKPDPIAERNLLRVANTMAPSFLRKLETAQLGAALLQVSLSAVLDATPASPLLDNDRRKHPEDYLLELVRLAVYVGIGEVFFLGNRIDWDSSISLLHKLMSAVKVIASFEVAGYSIVGQRNKIEHIVIVAVSNAIKHQVLYLQEECGLHGRKLSDLPQEFWIETISIRLNAGEQVLTIENVGTRATKEEFVSRFAERTKQASKRGTYDVLNAAVLDSWVTPGKIDLDARAIEGVDFDRLSSHSRELLTAASRYVVEVHLPNPFFERSVK